MAQLPKPKPPVIDNAHPEFEVGEPQMMSGHMCYKVKGVDAKGEFETTRRFNDFFALHAALMAKWPGCYVPRIPPKKAIVIHFSDHLGQQRYQVRQRAQILS